MVDVMMMMMMMMMTTMTMTIIRLLIIPGQLCLLDDS